MKKFLLILLIVVASSVTVEFDGSNLESWWSDLWDKIKEFVKSIPSRLKALYNWLVENGYWEQIIELVKKYGKPYATQLCTKWTGKEELCTDIVNLIFSFIK